MSQGIGALSAARRATDLAALAGGEVVDVLVVGGGITGAGVALDAASRGLSVALLERRDLAHGTSRWSSKLVHGGLRYLAQGDVALAWESARERAILMDVSAPHLVRALPILMPLHAGTPRAAAATAHAGMRIGDGMRALARTSRRRLPRARRAGAEEAWRYAPALRRDGLRGALLGWDGQLEDDAARDQLDAGC
ncbi:MAG: glycerol-3-phosphate dehydrogenase, partial [Solirubrobacteraceae bacterium]|nr:glycerol-3-phosphate dehydrogenase [Solirubrobacteraceae bacterium]